MYIIKKKEKFTIMETQYGNILVSDNIELSLSQELKKLMQRKTTY